MAGRKEAQCKMVLDQTRFAWWYFHQGLAEEVVKAYVATRARDVGRDTLPDLGGGPEVILISSDSEGEENEGRGEIQGECTERSTEDIVGCGMEGRSDWHEGFEQDVDALLEGQNEQDETTGDEESSKEYWGDDEGEEQEGDEERDEDGGERTEQNEGEERERRTYGEDEEENGLVGDVFRGVPWPPAADRVKRKREESDGEGGDSD